MKKIIIFLAAITAMCLGSSQTDSLEAVVQGRLEAGQRDRTTLKKMNTLIRDLVRTDMPRAQDWGFRALELGQSIGPSQELADVYNSVGWVFRSQGLHHIALDYYSKALQIYEELGLRQAFAWNQVSIGNVYFKLETMDLALVQYERAFELFSEIADTNGMALALSNIGMVEEENGRHQEALKRYIEARDLRRHLAPSFSQSYDTYQVGHGYMILGNDRKAVEHFNSALEMAREFDSKDNMARAYLGLGEVYERRGNVDSALVFYQLSTEFEDLSQVAKIYRKIAEMQHSAGRYGTALSSAERAISFARDHQLLEEEAEAFKLMSDIYLKLDLPFKSIEALQGHVTAVESMGKSDVMEAVTRMEVIQKEERQEKELALKEAEVAAQRIQRNMAVVIGVLLLTIASGLVLRYRYIKKTSRQMVENRDKIHEQELAIEAHEKDTLERELELRRRELTSQAMHMAQHQDFMNEIKNRLQSLTSGEVKNGSKTIQGLINKIDQDLLVKDEWKEFDTWFGEVHSQFYTKLDKSYPNLSPTERKLCVFLKLNLNIKEVAALSNLTPKTVEVYRSRLRKKLDVPQGENLVTFISNL